MKAITAIALTASFGFAAAANAEFVDVRFLGTAKGTSVKTTFFGNTRDLFAGQLNHRISNGTGLAAALNGDHVTFCSDFYQSVTSSNKQYEVVSVDLIPSSAPMGAAKAQALRNIYTTAGVNASDSAASNELAAAFQIAIWEIVTDFDGTASSLDLTAGSFKAKKTNGNAFSGSLASALTTIFTAATQAQPNQPNMIGLRSSAAQDQLLAGFVIPTPGTATLALTGVAFAAGRRRRA